MTSTASGTYSESFEGGQQCPQARIAAAASSRSGRHGKSARWSPVSSCSGRWAFLALFLKWKNGEMWRGASEQKAPWEGFKKPDFATWKSASYGHAGSGNAAFDDYKRETLKRLDEERRKLEEEQKSFREFVDHVRRAKDQGRVRPLHGRTPQCDRAAAEQRLTALQ